MESVTRRVAFMWLTFSGVEVRCHLTDVCTQGGERNEVPPLNDS